MKAHFAWQLALCFLTVTIGGFLLRGSAAHSASNEEAINRLASVPTFAFGGVGFAGTISSGEIDYRSILAAPSAKADFERVFAKGNVQAQCYALVGLRKADPERFKALAEQLEKSSAGVETMNGCIMKRQPMAAVVAKIKSGAYSGTN